MYLFCNSIIHVITLYSGHVCVYYASMLRCWHLVWILVRTDRPCLGVGCHTNIPQQASPEEQPFEIELAVPESPMAQDSPAEEQQPEDHGTEDKTDEEHPPLSDTESEKMY
jgi:hypothetical protein